MNTFDIKAMGLYNEFIEGKTMDNLKRDLSELDVWSLALGAISRLGLFRPSGE